jgi:hypothetical protein|tara:strand:- start:14774 stop:14938 length:165 start_codon:yes stop_codon:yes gene_type:complete
LAGWIIIVISVIYGCWIALAFVIAVPPPEYMIPRIIIVVVGLVGGWHLKEKLRK